MLARAGITASGPRLGYLLMRAELDAVICSGPRRGKQFTYALFDERVPPANPLPRDEALAKLTERFFAGHGPATRRDFAWWSGLTMAEAKTGVELTRSALVRTLADGTTYWRAQSASAPTADEPTPRAHLLPNYDEYPIAFQDHAASFDPSVLANLAPNDDALQAHIVVVDGLAVGGRRRAIQRRAITITTNLLVPLDRAASTAVQTAAEDYGRFLGLPVTVQSHQAGIASKEMV